MVDNEPNSTVQYSNSYGEKTRRKRTRGRSQNKEIPEIPKEKFPEEADSKAEEFKEHQEVNAHSNNDEIQKKGVKDGVIKFEDNEQISTVQCSNSNEKTRKLTRGQLQNEELHKIPNEAFPEEVDEKIDEFDKGCEEKNAHSNEVENKEIGVKDGVNNSKHDNEQILTLQCTNSYETKPRRRRTSKFPPIALYLNDEQKELTKKIAEDKILVAKKKINDNAGINVKKSNMIDKQTQDHQPKKILGQKLKEQEPILKLQRKGRKRKKTEFYHDL